MHMRFPRWLAVLLASTALTGCVPEASTTVPVPRDLATTALFACADTILQDLHRRDEQWNARITRRDVVAGRFETGDFDEANVMGYRVRLARTDAEPRADLSVRAAGPYFTDLGADRALAAYRTALSRCVARTGAANRIAHMRSAEVLS